MFSSKLRNLFPRHITKRVYSTGKQPEDQIPLKTRIYNQYLRTKARYAGSIVGQAGFLFFALFGATFAVWGMRWISVKRDRLEETKNLNNENKITTMVSIGWVPDKNVNVDEILSENFPKLKEHYDKLAEIQKEKDLKARAEMEGKINE